MTSPIIVGTTPYIWVADVSAAAPYYRDVLGFQVDYTYDYSYDGKDFGLANISRDCTRLQLRVCECEGQVHTGTTFFRMQVQGVDALFEEWTSKNVIVHSEPEDQPWGLRDFQVKDPEGNRIYVYEVLEGGLDA